MTKRKRQKRNDEETFSLSAMIDVVFLLLIFFIVTYVEPRIESHMAINHPGQPENPSPVRHTPLEAEIHPEGIQFMSRSVTLEQLESELFNAMMNNEKTPFFVKVSPEAREGQVIAVLDVCGKIDLKNINLQTLKSRRVW